MFTDRAPMVFPDPKRRYGTGRLTSTRWCVVTVEQRRYRAPVDGGDLAVTRWGDVGSAAVIAAHGVTASHQSWATVADEVAGQLMVIAPDLRGRGDSATLPGPYGITQHARDLAAVLDDAGVRRAVVAGHSMGGFVAATFAMVFPERTTAVVLVDGGPPLGPEPTGDVDVDAVLTQVIGPAMARLEQRFASADTYRRFWREHPAFRDSDVDPARVDAYADHDLHGPVGDMRSKVSVEVVRADMRDWLVNTAVRGAVERIAAPAVLLLAERGMLDGPTPLYPDEAIGGLRTSRGPLEVVRIPDTNHYSVAMGRAGAQAVAGQLRRFAGTGQGA